VAKQGLNELAEDVFRTAAMATKEAFVTEPTVAGALKLTAMLAKFADDSADFAVRTGLPEEKPACRRGCTSCCYLHVVALPAEVIAIASFLVRTLSSAEMDTLRRRLNTHIEATTGLVAADRRRVRLPCPLLDGNGDCRAHAVRPLSCRGWNSLDASLCDADRLDPSRDNPARLNLTQYVLAGRILEGLAAGTSANGRDHRRLDLVRALRVVLDDPGAVEKWVSGEDVFDIAANERVFPEPEDEEATVTRERLWSSLGPGFSTSTTSKNSS